MCVVESEVQLLIPNLQEPTCKLNSGKLGATVKNWTSIPKNETQMAEALVQIGECGSRRALLLGECLSPLSTFDRPALGWHQRCHPPTLPR